MARAFTLAAASLERPMSVLFRILSKWPLPALHLLGSVLGWLVWCCSSSYRRSFRELVAQAGLPFEQVRPAIADAGRLVAELPRLWMRPHDTSCLPEVQVQGQEIVDAVAHGRDVEAKIPHSDHDDVDKEFRPALSLIAAWIGELARVHHVDAPLLGTRQDIMNLVRKTANSRLSTGWRAEIVGRDIEKILSGEAGLSFDGRGRLRLLPTTLH